MTIFSTRIVVCIVFVILGSMRSYLIVFVEINCGSSFRRRNVKKVSFMAYSFTDGGVLDAHQI